MYLIIPGEPVSQDRHRLFFRKVKSVCYDPNARDKYTARILIKSYLREHYPEFEPFKFPRVSMIFHLPIPHGMSKPMKSLAIKGYVKHVKRPDVDNYIKFYLDCLNENIWKDDSCVSIGLAIKLYHEIPKTIIHIEETAQVLNGWELDHLIRPDSLDSPRSNANRNSPSEDVFDSFRNIPQCPDSSDLENAAPSAMQEFLALWDKAQNEFHQEQDSTQKEPCPRAPHEPS